MKSQPFRAIAKSPVIIKHTYCEATALAIRFKLHTLLAHHNLRRAYSGEKPLSIRKLGVETRLSHSSLLQIINNKATRIDLDTIERIMNFFKTDDLNDFLEIVEE